MEDVQVTMASIDGARIVPLRKVVNERGHLLEIQRSDDAVCPGIAQAYTTCTLPGVVKAWYRHRKQLDQIALVHGDATIVLYDAREDSRSRGQLVECVLTDEAPRLIQIPPGVWHGFKASGREPVYLLHLNASAHDAAHPDEDRLPPDSADIPYAWT
jgi:dTDP-4-dehydrorhamnose 3,5-epimerase